MEALRVENIAKNFGGLRVLQGISFNLEVGGNLAVIGPNGAGKTTLLNLLTGELPPTAGRVYFWGQDVTRMPTHRRIQLGVARSLQIPALFSTLTVLTAVVLAVQGTKPTRFDFFRSLSAHKDLYTKAQQLLETAGLWERRNDLVHSLSYGELRKMEISLTLASEPRLILLDEPSAGLTKAETEALTKMIKELAKDITVLFVAHDMDMVFGLADQIMVLYFGEIIARGKPAEIQVNPKVREIYLGIEKNAASA